MPLGISKVLYLALGSRIGCTYLLKHRYMQHSCLKNPHAQSELRPRHSHLWKKKNNSFVGATSCFFAVHHQLPYDLKDSYRQLTFCVTRGDIRLCLRHLLTIAFPLRLALTCAELFFSTGKRYRRFYTRETLPGKALWSRWRGRLTISSPYLAGEEVAESSDSSGR